MESISSEGSSKWSPDSLTDSCTLLLAITTTDFLSAPVITNPFLKYLLALTQSLQAVAKDIIQAVSEINHVKAALRDVRDNIDMHHSKWFSGVEQICADVGIQSSIPRVCGRQHHRLNVPAHTPSEYYCHSISIPVLGPPSVKAKVLFHHSSAINSTRPLLDTSVPISKAVEDISPNICQLGEMYDGNLLTVVAFRVKKNFIVGT